MNFCSNCGSANIVIKIPEGDNLPRFCCRDCIAVHYQNPNMVVGAIPVWDGKILLARRNIEPRKGLWNLPCGFLELNETVEAGAMREVLEETGAAVILGPLQTVFNLVKAQQVYLIFTAKMLNSSFTTTAESAEVKLFSINEIPWDEIAFSSNTFALKAFIADLKMGNNNVHFGTYKHNSKK